MYIMNNEMQLTFILNSWLLAGLVCAHPAWLSKSSDHWCYNLPETYKRQTVCPLPTATEQQQQKCVCVCAYMCMCACMYTCMCMYVCVCVCAHTHMHREWTFKGKVESESQVVQKAPQRMLLYTGAGDFGHRSWLLVAECPGPPSPNGKCQCHLGSLGTQASVYGY